MDNTKWGDIPTWIAALGTVSTFIIYYFLLRGEIKKREQEEKYREEYTQRRVAAWFDKGRLIVKNGGDESVYYTVVTVAPMGVDLTSEEDSGKRVDLVFGTFGPGEKCEESLLPSYITTKQFPNIPEIAIEFTDYNGKHWRREPNGRFHQLSKRRPFD